MGSEVFDLIPYFPIVFVVLVLLHGAAGSIRRARRARRRGDSYRGELTAGSVLQAGDAIVAGRVAYATSTHEAVSVELVQVGTETESSGSWSHAWTEVSRKVTVAPFYLVQGTADQQRRIRVQPTRTSQLFDELEKKVVVPVDPPSGKPRRQCTASLVPEESVWVVGRLEREQDPEGQPALVGYRDSARSEGWVMRGAPTLLISSVPLVEHFRGRASLHRGQAVLCALVLLAPLYLLAARIDRVQGYPTMGRVIAVSTRTDDDSHVTSYEAILDAHGSTVSGGRFATEPAVGELLPVRLGAWSSNPGYGIAWTDGELAALAALVVGSLALRLGLATYSRRRLPWYRSTRPYVDRGTGRLMT